MHSEGWAAFVCGLWVWSFEATCEAYTAAKRPLPVASPQSLVRTLLGIPSRSTIGPTVAEVLSFSWLWLSLLSPLLCGWALGLCSLMLGMFVRGLGSTECGHMPSRETSSHSRSGWFSTWAVLLESSMRLAEAMFPGASGLRKRIRLIGKGPSEQSFPIPFLLVWAA